PVAGQAGDGRQAGHNSRGSVDPAAALAAPYRRRVLHLAARHLTARTPVADVVEELADIRDAVLGAALAIAPARPPPGAAPCRPCPARSRGRARDCTHPTASEWISVAGAPSRKTSKKPSGVDASASAVSDNTNKTAAIDPPGSGSTDNSNKPRGASDAGSNVA